MTHYHIGANVPGYLPEGDVYIVSTKRAAQRALADDVRRFRDDQYDLPRRGRRTASGTARDGFVHFDRSWDAYDLGISLWWLECNGADCEVEGQ